MNILLTGANGFIGRNVRKALEAAGHQVHRASRQVGVDFTKMLSPADWLPYLKAVDAVINCVGIIGERGSQQFARLHTQAPIALFQACEQAGVRRVIQVSALGADDSAFSAYHLSKRAADDYLRATTLDWFVLRPSLIYGKGGGSAKLFMGLARLPRIPVLGDGQQMLQPVHISDVVATVLQCLDSNDARQTIDILGPESISYAEWLQKMRAAQGLKRTGYLHCPFALAMAMTRVGRHLFPLLHPLLQPENLQMLQQGYHADVQALAKFLGRLPRTNQPDLFFSDAAILAKPTGSSI